MAKVTDGIGLALSGKVEKMVFVQFNGGTYTAVLPGIPRIPGLPIC